MKLIVSGLLNKQSASRLLAREITVKARRSHIMRKIQADSLANLVKFSMQIYKNEIAEMILPVDIQKKYKPILFDMNFQRGSTEIDCVLASPFLQRDRSAGLAVPNRFIAN